jgi:hypothetical protein
MIDPFIIKLREKLGLRIMIDPYNETKREIRVKRHNLPLE